MSAAGHTFTGIIHGKTIELDQAPGLPDGQVVTITVQPAEASVDASQREAILRSSGGWADDAAELDAYLEWSRQQRKVDRPEIEP